MRIFSATLLLLFFAWSLPANEEKVRVFVTTYNEIMFSDKPAPALEMLHPSFLEVAADGTLIDIMEARKILTNVSLLVNALREDSTLLELFEVLYAYDPQRRKLPLTLRQQLFLTQHTQEGKVHADLLRQELKKHYNDHKAKLQEISKTLRIISIKIKEDRAIVIYEQRSYVKDCDERTHLELIKVDGVWLAVKSVSKYIDPEEASK